MSTVDKLKDSAVVHFNRSENKKKKYTFAIVYNERDNSYRLGVTFFNEKDDIYNRNFAAKKAVGRAFSDTSFKIATEVVYKAGGTIKALFVIKKAIGDKLDKSSSTISSMNRIFDAILEINNGVINNG